MRFLESDELDDDEAGGPSGPYVLVDLGALVRRIANRDDGGVVSEAASEVSTRTEADDGGRGIRSALTFLGITIGIAWGIRRATKGRTDLGEGADRIQETVSERTTEDDSRRRGRYSLPLLGLVLGVGYVLMRRRTSDEDSMEGKSPSEATEGLTDRAAQTIQRRGEVIAERIETGTESLAEQVQTGGETATERMEDAEEAIDEAEERVDETADEATDRADEMTDEAMDRADEMTDEAMETTDEEFGTTDEDTYSTDLDDDEEE